jgi:hypothetical protein
MKILPTVAGLILAGAFSTTVQAAPSQGEVMTLCKAEIKQSFEDISRIRTSRFKDRASGTYVTYRVSRRDQDTQKVLCTFRDGVASLTDDTGALIASKTSSENAGT